MTAPSNGKKPPAGAEDLPRARAGTPPDESGPERRARIVGEIMDRTGIDEEMIAKLVRGFYARVQADPLLGPVFAVRVADWDEHIAKLCAFWSSVALLTGRYHGQPMPVHQDLPVDARHFDRWIALFEETANTVCPPVAAAHFIERARRIADSFELGIAARKGRIHSPRFTVRDRVDAVMRPA